ncbi:putative P-loop kinase [Tokyovirus A1]|uniref:putative P-loop kinase n=1 Tax=Tokyovirus A1 TaxID=1826170 RepID=UPI0007A96421|nr:putative P-loop kinase [Tokyovirus A1]BAU79960.1 putative P-loop kinase [Tokyovirus A1]
MFSLKFSELFCGRKQQQKKTVGLVGDSGIGKTRELWKINGAFCGSHVPTKNYEEHLIETKNGVILVLDISGDIGTVQNPRELVSRCDILFGSFGSSPELLNFWREQTRDARCFFEMVALENLEQRLETI